MSSEFITLKQLLKKHKQRLNNVSIGLKNEDKDLILNNLKPIFDDTKFDDWDSFFKLFFKYLSISELLENIPYIFRGMFMGCHYLPKELIIPGNIECIDERAFEGSSGAETIKILDGVTRIRRYAFQDCYTSLKSIEIADSVEFIGVNAFEGCRNLVNIKLPNGINCLCDRLFSGCISLTSITIPDNIEGILDETFSNCTNLTTVILPKKLQYLGSNIFENCPNLQLISYKGTSEEFQSNIPAYRISEQENQLKITCTDKIILI